MTASRSDIATLVAAWGGPVPDDQIALFVALSAEKRAIALERISSLRKMTTGHRPSTAVQRAEAELLGMGLKRLQGLMRAWAHPNLAVVTPHGRKTKRQPGSSPAREITARIVDRALRRNRVIAEPAVHRRISKMCERLGIQPPARMTVRTLLDQRRRELPPEIIDFEKVGCDEEHPTRCGEELLLTSQPFKLNILQESGKARPAIALILVDVASQLILAFDASCEPGSLGQDAARRLRDDPPSTLSWLRPRRILIAAPRSLDEAWVERFIHHATSMGIDAEHQLQRRIRRWMAALWRVDAELLPTTTSPTDESGSWPAVTSSEFGELLEKTVQQHNRLTDQMLSERPNDVGIETSINEASDALIHLFEL